MELKTNNANRKWNIVLQIFPITPRCWRARLICPSGRKKRQRGPQNIKVYCRNALGARLLRLQNRLQDAPCCLLPCGPKLCCRTASALQIRLRPYGWFGRMESLATIRGAPFNDASLRYKKIYFMSYEQLHLVKGLDVATIKQNNKCFGALA